MAAKELIWDAMLQHIISGMASKGSRKWSRITPEMAEKAKPENPDAIPPRKIVIVSIRGLSSLIIQHEILRTPRAKVPAMTLLLLPRLRGPYNSPDMAEEKLPLTLHLEV
jgi:hypothetical protein